MDRNELRNKLKPMLPMYLAEKGILVSHKAIFHCLNPEHPDQNPSMSYYPGNHTCRCFGCGAIYDIFDLIQQDYDCDYPQSVEIAYKKYGDMLDAETVDKTRSTEKPQATVETKSKNINLDKKNTNKIKNKETVNLEGGFKMDFSKDYEKWKANLAETNYLTKRGISMETAQKHNVGYDPEYQSILETEAGNKSVKGALVIPTSAESYIVRPTTEEAGLSCKYRKKGPSHIFNSNILTQISDPVFVTEGEIDAMSVEELGYDAVALGGVNNVDLLVRFLKDNDVKCKLLLALDNDEAGKKANKELAEKLTEIEMDFQSVSFSDEDHSYKDPNEALVKDKDYLKAKLAEYAVPTKNDELSKARDYITKSCVYSSLDSFLNAVKNKKNQLISTGFDGLDEALEGGLRFGAYYIGAIPSCGKSTLLLQLADQIAANGTSVLYFSFEMGINSLIAKSTSRIIMQERIRRNEISEDIITASDILIDRRYEKFGESGKKEISKALHIYKNTIASNLYIKCVRPGISSRLTVEQIREEIQRLLSALRLVNGDNSNLVVMIDYLQLIAPHNENASDKMIIDHNSAALEGIAHEFQIPLIVVSSLNRDSYNQPVSLKSFKESGNIEYNADQLLGLQYSKIGKDGFKLDVERDAFPRKVELTILKQRMGRTGQTVKFNYYSKCDYFETESDDNDENEGLFD